ncbi:hypothetical protein ACNPNP_00100 [Microbacterium sp. AGC85]
MNDAALRASDTGALKDPATSISAKQAIAVGRTTVGIEVDADGVRARLVRSDTSEVLAERCCSREVRLPSFLSPLPFDHVWWTTVQAVNDLGTEVKNQFGLLPYRIQSVDVASSDSSVFAFGAERNLVTFDGPHRPRTEAAEELSALFGTPVSDHSFIAQLHQAIRDGDPLAGQVSTVMTLAGILHYRLTGQIHVSSDEASHLFPFDDVVGDYDQSMAQLYDALAGGHLSAPIRNLLPAVVPPGVEAGSLTSDAAGELIFENGLRPGATVRFR